MSARTFRSQRGVTLVELLVVMIIMGVLSTMIIMTWSSLNKNYFFNSRSNQQRDLARLGVSRLANEVRDIQQPASGGNAITLADPYEIRFYTSFNLPDNGTVTSGATSKYTVDPVYVRYFMQQDPKHANAWMVWRQVDVNNTGTFDGTDTKITLVTYVVNQVISPLHTSLTPMFTYTYMNTSGTLTTANTVPAVSRAQIYNVQVKMLVDLNPGAAPNYIDLTTSIQPRNLRAT